MHKRIAVVLALGIIMVVGVCCTLRGHAEETAPAAAPAAQAMSLPAPDLTHATTLEQALAQRRSVRKYADAPISLAQASNLLWAAQGITEPKRGLRTAPSAMALYPLRVYLVAGKVTDLPAGAYKYVPQGHKLELVVAGDQRVNVGNQQQMTSAPAVLVYTYDTTVFKRATPEMGLAFANLEAGHSAQNVLLEEVALGLVGVPMGGFDAAKLKATLKLADTEVPLYAVSAGQKG